MAAYLAAFICEDELDGVVCVPGDRDDLAGYPAEFLVREPDLRALAVYVFRHGGCKSEVDLPTSPILPICPLAESGTRHVARCYIPVGADDHCPEHTTVRNPSFTASRSVFNIRKRTGTSTAYKMY